MMRKGWFTVAIAGLLALPTMARADANEEQMAEARKQFQAGVNLLDDPDGAKYEDAYLAFRKAYELSKSPKVLGNMGFCAFHLERDGEAIDAYGSYLREAPDIDDRERQQIQKDLSTLTSTVAKFKATTKMNSSAITLIDTRVQTRGNPVINTYPLENNEVTVRLRPGRHSFKLKIADRESAPFDAQIDPGSSSSHEFVFPVVAPPPSEAPQQVRPRPSAAGPVLVTVVGLVAIGAGVVTGVLARGKTDDLEKGCPNNTCPRTYDFESDRDSARTFGTIADASFIGGGVLVAGGILWYLLQPKGGPVPKGSNATLASPVARASLLPTPAFGCGARGCSAGFEGSF